MSLQTDHRPKTLNEFIGNNSIRKSLSNVLKRPNPPNAFLFTGMGGTGKTTLGRITARCLKCNKIDYKELNAANDRGIDAMRALIESMKLAPMSGKCKVYLLDECHMLGKVSQEALLKSLEEPPKHVHWILCTTNPEALRPTLKRRCHTYELNPLLENELQNLFNIVLKKERRENISRVVREKIIEVADGSAGQALKLLDMIIDMDDESHALATIKSAGSWSGDEGINKVAKILVHKTMPKQTKWRQIKTILKEYKGDGETERRQILGYLNTVLLNNGNENTFFMMIPFSKNFFDSGRAGLVMACYEAIHNCE